ncbi:hypothetical protein MVEN_01577900 [Mycena venus]|uniref:Uncharacterized protein n=1 Tax=Mycena venus TaxID=2733690 RepID=A0A8H6XSG5_9AGAR|nr:hypothetical protein MVEN_01577900 [Mycena venus]
MSNKASCQSTASSIHPPAREHHYSDVLLSERLRRVLSDPASRATFVDLPKWHASLAVWCLSRSNVKSNARDIFYASDFWAQHVCSARPSQEIWDALQALTHSMSAGFPRDVATVDVEDTRELIVLYRSTYSRTATALAAGQRVKIMGGSMSMLIQ